MRFGHLLFLAVTLGLLLLTPTAGIQSSTRPPTYRTYLPQIIRDDWVRDDIYTPAHQKRFSDARIAYPIVGGAFTAGDVQIDVSLEIPTLNLSTPNDNTGIVISNGLLRGDGIRMLRLTYEHGGSADGWRLQYRKGDSGWGAYTRMVLITPSRSATFTLRIAADGQHIDLKLPDGSGQRHVLPDSLYAVKPTMGLLANIEGGATLHIPALALSRRVGALPPRGPALRMLAQQHGISVGAMVDVEPYGAYWLDQRVGPLIDEPRYQQTLAQEFDVVFSLAFAWTTIHNQDRATYDFTLADDVVAAAQRRGQRVRGFTLVYGLPTAIPDWLRTRAPTRDEALAILQEHITTLVSRYRGKVHEWIVVNEGFWPDDFWRQTIGPDYIDYAFQFARAADPTAILLYNDFDNEVVGERSNAMYALVQRLQQRGIPIDGVGFQMHLRANQPPSVADVITNMQRFAALGVPIYITELDIHLVGLTAPRSEQLAIQATIMGNMATACIQSAACRSLTFWGFTDAVTHALVCDACHAEYAHPEAPLPFDEVYQPKPAYYAVQQVFMQTDHQSWRMNLDNDPTSWQLYIHPPDRQATYTCYSKTSVPIPTTDQVALRLSITPGCAHLPYTSLTYYRQFPGVPEARFFSLQLRYRFTPTTWGNQGEPSRIQGLQVVMSKGQGTAVQEWKFRWNNVADSLPQQPTRPMWQWYTGQGWEDTGVRDALAGDQWHTLMMVGEITPVGGIQYRSLTSNGVIYPVEYQAVPTGVAGDALTVAVVLEGNFQQDAYELLLDQVGFTWHTQP